jgi:hypothetical protein
MDGSRVRSHNKYCHNATIVVATTSPAIGSLFILIAPVFTAIALCHHFKLHKIIIETVIYPICSMNLDHDGVM